MGDPSPGIIERVGGTLAGYGQDAEPALLKDDAAARTRLLEETTTRQLGGTSTVINYVA